MQAGRNVKGYRFVAFEVNLVTRENPKKRPEYQASGPAISRISPVASEISRISYS